MANTNKHYFYVLRCADNTYYAGYTTDVMRREQEHNSKSKGAKYTRFRQPVKMIYYEVFETRAQATQAEAKFKKLTRQQKEVYLNRATTKEFPTT
ncbi:GIY-YIG nuclease family protein [Carnobacteriaceae bacterium zg-ZUI240]|nr:GIY-YIG nuclease family protein [Carnobacteriaceae bacterium zg-ZUI240]